MDIFSNHSFDTHVCLFDMIGQTYDDTRRADSKLTYQLMTLLKQEDDDDGLYLEVGCGSGNYTHALSLHGLQIQGLDCSVSMLAKAKQKYCSTPFYQGDAMQLPFQNEQFSGLLYMLAIHHFSDCAKAFHEAYRVSKHNGRIVIFSVTPVQLEHYWLSHYFPEAISRRAASLLSFEELEALLKKAGFCDVISMSFNINDDIDDLFLYSGKRKPHIYLDPIVRRNMSFFSSLCDENELELGLKRLKNDIVSSHIDEIIAKYENNIGDCLFVSARKS